MRFKSGSIFHRFCFFAHHKVVFFLFFVFFWIKNETELPVIQLLLFYFEKTFNFILPDEK